MFGKPLSYPLAVALPFHKITSDYGYRSFRGGAFHSALDLRAASGTKVIAPAAGRVTQVSSGAGTGCGGNLRIDHSPTLQTRYCHLSDILVSRGQEVKAGQVIALSGGNSGDPGAGNSQVAHLHFETAVRSGAGGSWQLADPKTYTSVGMAGSASTAAKVGLSLVALAGGAAFLWWVAQRREG